MLVLSRKKNETIRINDNITIMVIEIRSNGSVRLGIQAPLDVAVNRGEIYDQIQKEGKRS